MGEMMRQAFSEAPTKPRQDDPCNGCGICCILEPCLVATQYLKATDKCPALEWSAPDKRFYCGMVVRPLHYLVNIQAPHLKGVTPPPDFEPQVRDWIIDTLGGIDGRCDSEDF